MKHEHFQLETVLPCPPGQAFAAWLDSSQHGAMIGGKAFIEPGKGGAFEIWEGAISGETTHVSESDMRIEQNWRYDYTDWPRNLWSKLAVRFEPHGRGHCKLLLTHGGVPTQHAADVKDGWKRYYFDPMKEYFAAHSEFSL